MYNTDGTKIIRLSDLKGSIIVLINNDEKGLFEATVEYAKKIAQKHARNVNRSTDDYRNVMKNVIHNWYDNNLQDWRQRSQQMISDDNIHTYMDMYKTPNFDEKNNTTNVSADKSFVYDNDEYKASTIQKYGKFQPPSSKSPLREKVMDEKVEEQTAKYTDGSFFATQSNYTGGVIWLRLRIRCVTCVNL